MARIECQSIAETRGLTAAKEVAGKVLAGRTTDPAYDELELWMTWHDRPRSPPPGPSSRAPSPTGASLAPKGV